MPQPVWLSQDIGACKGKRTKYKTRVPGPKLWGSGLLFLAAFNCKGKKPDHQPSKAGNSFNQLGLTLGVSPDTCPSAGQMERRRPGFSPSHLPGARERPRLFSHSHLLGVHYLTGPNYCLPPLLVVTFYFWFSLTYLSRARDGVLRGPESLHCVHFCLLR